MPLLRRFRIGSVQDDDRCIWIGNEAARFAEIRIKEDLLKTRRFIPSYSSGLQRHPERQRRISGNMQYLVEFH
jgi:hypothetical protein